jgi:hypothetical protein
LKSLTQFAPTAPFSTEKSSASMTMRGTLGDRRPVNADERHRAEAHTSASLIHGDDFDLSSPFPASVLLFIRSMKNQQTDDSQLQKDPDDWKTGDEPMTAAQRSYLETLAQDSGETFDEELTKAEASKRIEELRSRSPRVAEGE